MFSVLGPINLPVDPLRKLIVGTHDFLERDCASSSEKPIFRDENRNKTEKLNTIRRVINI